MNGLSEQRRRVFDAFLKDPTIPLYGYQLLSETGVLSGTLYPILKEWEEQGILVSSWKSPEVGEEKFYQPRKYYLITEKGLQIARVMMR